MTKQQIVSDLAKEKRVETMVAKIAHSALTDDLQDLCQMVYLIMLEYEDDKILDLYEHNQMQFFIARIILNQFHSSSSPFHTTFRRPRQKAVSIDGWDQPDEK